MPRTLFQLISFYPFRCFLFSFFFFHFNFLRKKDEDNVLNWATTTIFVRPAWKNRKKQKKKFRNYLKFLYREEANSASGVGVIWERSKRVASRILEEDRGGVYYLACPRQRTWAPSKRLVGISGARGTAAACMGPRSCDLYTLVLDSENPFSFRVRAKES